MQAREVEGEAGALVIHSVVQYVRGHLLRGGGLVVELEDLAVPDEGGHVSEVLACYAARVEEAHEPICPDRPAQVRRGVYVGTEILYTMLCLLFLVFWLLSMNESAVATEYFLLAAFLVIAVLDGFLSFRLRSAYQL